MELRYSQSCGISSLSLTYEIVGGIHWQPYFRPSFNEIFIIK